MHKGKKSEDYVLSKFRIFNDLALGTPLKVWDTNVGWKGPDDASIV